MPIVGLLLAAGQGRRFGGDKLLAPLPAATFDAPAGTALGVASALHLVAALPDTVAVVRAGERQLVARLGDAGVRVVECANADNGMGASLACGVAATADADGWVVALADMPWIAPATIMTVSAALREGADIAAPAYRGERGHPVGFARRHYASLAALTGDAGARDVLFEHRDRLTLLATDDAGVVRDVDTPAALAGTRDCG
jgi:molybdenum cofactor cytidylyltransferase